MDMMSQVTVYFEKVYKHEGISWENFNARTKLQTDSQKLQKGKFSGPEANLLEKSPCTLDSTEPLLHADRHVRNPPLIL